MAGKHLARGGSLLCDGGITLGNPIHLAYGGFDLLRAIGLLGAGRASRFLREKLSELGGIRDNRPSPNFRNLLVRDNELSS